MSVNILEHDAVVGDKNTLEKGIDYLCLLLGKWIQKYELYNKQILIIYGSSLGTISLKDVLNGSQAYMALPLALRNRLSNDYPDFKYQELKLTNTCISSLDSLQNAKLYLDNRIFEYVIIVAYDFVSDFIIAGLNSMNLISSKQQIKSFSTSQDGIVLSCGIGALLLNNNEKKSCIVSSVAIINDSIGLASIEMRQRGLRKAIKLSLRSANILTKSVDYALCSCNGEIKAEHAMIEAIKNCGISERAICCIKRKHALGASGIIEIDSFLKCFDSNQIQSYLNFYKFDCTQGIDSGKTCKILLVGVGFGGVNGAAVLELSK